jgi:glycosyltransferase involved in cell wall biosynthesis
VVRYHDAIPLLMPHTISDRSYHQASHYHALKRNVADGAWFACVSDATRKDLLSVFPEVADRAVTIHNMVSHHYFAEESSRRLVPEILNIRRSQSIKGGGGRMLAPGTEMPPFLLMVSTIEPRKNHLALLSAWEQLRAELLPDLQLVLVGALGWEHKSIVKRFRPWLDRGGMHLLEDVPAPELRMLYHHAAATVCPSFGEGFDFSGVEAMRCGGVVAASDIPVHHDIFDDAAEYFSPYSAGQLAAALARLIGRDADARREALVRRGFEVSSRYLPERVLPQWQAFLARLGEG